MPDGESKVTGGNGSPPSAAVDPMQLLVLAALQVTSAVQTLQRLFDVLGEIRRQAVPPPEKPGTQK